MKGGPANDHLTVGFIVYGVHRNGLKDPMGEPSVDEAIIQKSKQTLKDQSGSCRQEWDKSGLRVEDTSSASTVIPIGHRVRPLRGCCARPQALPKDIGTMRPDAPFGCAREGETAGTMCGCLQRLRVLLTPRLQRSGFDILSSRLHFLGTSEMDICRRHVVERVVVRLAIVVIHETGDLLLQIPRVAERLHCPRFFIERW